MYLILFHTKIYFQKPTFQRGQYDQAILNIIRATWERAQGKQARPSTDDGTSGGGSPFAPKPPKSGGVFFE
jgi:hypothetical protein